MEGPVGLVDVGPYRATRLWLDLVQMFVSGMPLKRHWRNFKVIENCFTGREAVKWFHGALLQSTKASNLDCFSRSQTITLLDKFFNSGVFTSISGNYANKFRVSSMDLYRLSAEAMNGGTLHLPFGQNIQNLPQQQNRAVDEESKENKISLSNKKIVQYSAIANTEINQSYPRSVRPPPHPHHQRASEHLDWSSSNTHTSCVPIIKGAKPKVLGVLAPRNPPDPTRGRQRAVAPCSPGRANGHYRSSSAGPLPTRDRCDNRISAKQFSSEVNFPLSVNDRQWSKHETGMHLMPSEPRRSAQSLDRVICPQYPQQNRMFEPETRTDVAMHISLAAHASRENAGVVLRQRPLHNVRRAGHWRNTIGPSHTHERATSYDVQSSKENSGSNQNVCEESNTYHKNNQHFSPTPQSLSVQTSSLSESTRNLAYSVVSALPSPSVRSNDGLHEVQDIDGEFQDIAWKNAFKSRILMLFPGSLLASLMPLSMPASWVKPGDEIRGNFVTLLETLFDVQRQGNNSCPEELSEKLCKSVIAHFTALSQFYSFGSDIYHLLYQGFIILQHLDEKTYQLKCRSPGVVSSKRSSVARLPDGSVARQSNDVVDLPPNACFETEFLSASPVTRIISVTSLHRNATKKALFDFEGTKRKSIAPSLRRRNSLHRTSSKQNTGIDHLCNLSGGYVNPGLDAEIDVIPDLDYVAAMSCLQKLMECSRKSDAKKIDMALLSQCRRWDSGETEERDVVFESKDISGEGISECEKRWENHDYVNVGFRLSESESESGSDDCDGYDGGDSSTESEGASFHTAVCTPSINATQLSICVDSVWLGHVDATAIEFMRLVLLCMEPQRRNHLKQLLLALKVVSPSIKSLAKIVDALAETLTTHPSVDIDVDFMKRLLNFMVAHQGTLFDIPQGLLEQIEHSSNFLKRQQAPSTISLPIIPSMQIQSSAGYLNHQHGKTSSVSLPQELPPSAELCAISAKHHVKASTISLPARLTRNNSEGQFSYCTQVSTEEFEQQKLTVSQMAIAELLEQLLNDCKMSVKEKKKRLKMFKDSYPHIYYRRFPLPERTEKKRLLQPVLTKFKSMRI